MFTSVVELLITKMCFLKKDSKWVFFVAIMYIPVNFAYTKLDNPVYPWAALNWDDPIMTLGLFVFQACFMYASNYTIAILT